MSVCHCLSTDASSVLVSATAAKCVARHHGKPTIELSATSWTFSMPYDIPLTYLLLSIWHGITVH